MILGGMVGNACAHLSSAEGFRSLGTVPNRQSPKGKFATIGILAMTPEERQLVNDLCKRIAEEKDASVFRFINHLVCLSPVHCSVTAK